MAGRIVRVCPPRDFDFDDLGNNDSQDITVGERIDCSQYDQVDVIVRVHTAATIPTSATIKVVLYSDGFTADDPSQDFFDEIDSVELNSTLKAAGTFVVETFSANLGSMLAVKVRGTMPSPATSLDLNARLSIDLALKTC